jgi:hypothetical protein
MNCAGREYVEVLAGQTDFTLYRMTKPWDHAAGALMMEEAGGQALRFNGARFKPADRIDSGIIAAPSRETVAEVRAALESFRVELNRKGFPIEARCDSNCWLVGGQQEWPEPIRWICGSVS